MDDLEEEFAVWSEIFWGFMQAEIDKISRLLHDPSYKNR